MKRQCPKKRKRSDKCTHIPPNTTAPITNINKTNSPDVSQIIAAANHSIYGTSYRNINVVPPVNQHNTPINNQQIQQQYFQLQTLPNMASSMLGPCITTTPTLSSNTFTLPLVFTRYKWSTTCSV